MTEDLTQVPKWLTKLEEQRERRLKVRLGHETGAGAPCLTCGEKCPGLDLHFWRKICKNCKCGKENHDVSDDDIYGFAQFHLLGHKPIKSKKIVLPGKNEAVDLEWTPKGATKAVEKYLGELPPELLPVKGTEAAQLRKQRLLKQMPAHDIDPALCHALTEDEIEKFMEYVAHVKQNSVGQGHITQLSLLRGQLHNMRLANDKLISQKIAGEMATSQNANVHPYGKTDSLSRNLQQKLTLNANNPQSMQYPEENQQYPVDATKIRDFKYDTNLNNKQKRTGIYSNERDPEYGIGLESDMREFGTVGQFGAPTLPHYAPGSYKTYENSQNPINMGPIRDFTYDVNVNPSQTQYPFGYSENPTLQRPSDLKIGSPRRFPQGYNPNPNLNVPEYVLHPTDVKGGSMGYPPGAQEGGFRDGTKGQQFPYDYGGNANPIGTDGKGNLLPRYPPPYNPNDYTGSDSNPSGPDFKGSSLPRYPQQFAKNTNANAPEGGQNRGEDPQFQGYGPNSKGGSLPRYPPAYNANSNANVAEFERNPTMEQLTSIRDLTYPTSEIRSAIYYNEDDVAPDLPTSDPRDLENSNAYEIPVCHKCKKVFEAEEIVISIERTNALWHTDCFRCEICEQILADLVYFYHKKTDKVYCGRDYAQIKGIPRCSACDELIFVSEYCLAEDSTFHVRHFCCFECDTPLAGQSYVMEGAQPLCIPCYDNCKAARCHTCGDVIHPDQQGLNVKDVHFHVTPECFACKYCKKSLLGGKVMVKNGNVFCSGECFQRHG